MPVIQPQPTPFSWKWQPVPGTVTTTDGEVRNVTWIMLQLSTLVGSPTLYFTPEAFTQFVEHGEEAARQARSNIITATEIPNFPPGRGNGLPPGLSGPDG